MKKSTLILIAIAAVLVALVYFLEIKKDDSPEVDEDQTSKAAFTFKREDVASITVSRQGETFVLESQDGKWLITQPINAPADEGEADSLARAIVDARVERKISASEENKGSYGLAEPAVTLVVKLKSGEEHTLALGNKDYSGLSAYAQIDNSNEVAIVGSSLLTSAEKSLDDVRDKSVVGVSQFDLRGLMLTNENGKLALTKESGEWKLTSPATGDADQSEVDSLVTEITTAKVTEFVTESDQDLKKYGLDNPKISVTLQLQSGERLLAIGAEAEGNYYAKTSERAQIFKVDSTLFEKLNVKPASLRSKDILSIEQDDVTRIQITNPHLKLIAEKKDDKWVVQEPADNKDKEFSSWKVFTPLETKATELLDNPPPAARARLAKPAITVQLTGKDGKTTVVRVSSADGDSAYVQVEGRPTVYKVEKSIVEQLSFKIADAVI
jgi:hypothetical protein